jgi:16S rRNA processing protein RimM
MSTVDASELVTVGQIERPFGVRGEVKVRSLTDVPGRWEALTDVNLIAPSGKRFATRVTNVRRAGNRLLVGLAGITTPEEAGQWRGGFIEVPRGTPPALPADQYYECDLIGLDVRDEQGHSLGTLERVWELPGSHVFVVRGAGGEVLVPAAKDLIAAVDLDRRVMTVRMVEGLGQ